MTETMLRSFISISLAITLSLISISTSSLVETTAKVGFNIDLIHRDSPSSPHYNPSLSHSQRLARALQRSFHRSHHLKNRFHSKKYQMDVIPDSNGEYLMNISIGTPPVPTPAIIDTGSDLIWLQCQPCIHCYKQKAPIFNPNRSSTYKNIPCPVDFSNSFSNRRNECEYAQVYGDGSSTSGIYATEKFTLGSHALLNTTFGCGHKNDGFTADESGLVGLGMGSLSLISQMGSLAAGKFSYCLVPMLDEYITGSRGTLNFGKSAKVHGHGKVSTPIFVQLPDTFYHLRLEGISVGEERLDANDSSSSSGNDTKGNIIIDSGTTLTLLPPDFYNNLESTVKRVVKLRTIPDPQHLLSLCYPPSKVNTLPTMTVHFKGADVKLSPLNTFVKTSEQSLCLAFAPSSGISIYGNLAQINFLVGYNLSKKTVTFKPTNCTKL